MSALPFQPQYSFPKNTKPRVRGSQFGGSYKLRVPDGLNHMPRSWSVRFILTKAQRDTLEAFFRGLNACTPFTWTLPTGEVYQCVASEWSDTPQSFDVYEFTASFEEDFS